MNVNEARDTSPALFCDVDTMFATTKKKNNKNYYIKCQSKLQIKKKIYQKKKK